MNDPENNYPRLFSEGRIGSLRLKNRIISSPMEKNLGDPDGSVTRRYLGNVRARAGGGAALICPEDLYIDPGGKGNMLQLGIHDDAMIPGLQRLCGAVKDGGAAVVAEINHGGRQALLAATGTQPVGPSPIPFEGFRHGEMPRELARGEIEGVVASFEAAAKRARAAGFDAVMIHGAHGYLLNQFFSPRSNRREDEYGGGLEGRMRLPLEVAKSVRRELGDDFPLMYRLTAVEGLEGGLELDDVLALCRALEAAGVDHIDVSAGTYESSALITPSMEAAIAPNVDVAGEIKKGVGIGVSVVGRIMDPDTAEEILRSGRADFVTMGRALHADPYLPRKALEGRAEDIRPCIGCLKCSDLLGTGGPVLCTVNSRAGQEEETRIRRAGAVKSVLVAGGGPAGLEAARVAALRGHRVTLMEMSGELGGQVRYAAKAPGRADLMLLVQSLESEVRNLGVEVCLWTRVDVDEIRGRAPDEVVLATGALFGSSRVPGGALTPGAMLAGGELTPGVSIAELDPMDAMANGWDGRGLALIQGGGMRGCAVAGRLAELGGEVIVVEPGETLAGDLGPRARAPMVEKLTARRNVKIFVNTSLEGFDGDGAVLRNENNELCRIKGVRLVVPASLVEPRIEIFASLADEFPHMNFHPAGDCSGPRGIFEAVQEGAAAGRAI